MEEKYNSLLEIALSLMEKKKKPQTLKSIINEVFKRKGMEKDEQSVAQFEVDFMLSGYFVYCGEDKDKNQMWDLKERQTTKYLGSDVEEFNKEDEEATKNELRDETVYASSYDTEEDEDDNKEDQDDIAEGLHEIDEDSESEEIESKDFESDEDDMFEEDDEEDEIAAELEKRKNEH